MLLIGDDAGILHRFMFDERDWHACDGRLPSKCHKYEVYRGISSDFTQCHEGGWLTRCRYIADLNSIITSSTNGEIRLWGADDMKMHSVYQHTCGVHNFDWSSVLRTLAFCGGDREVTLWNPYSKTKQATLHGHSAIVVQVAFDDANHQLVTLAKDLSVRVWDMRAQRVIQIFRDDSEQGLSPKWLPTMYLNPSSTCILPRVCCGGASYPHAHSHLCMPHPASSIITTTRSLSVWPLVPLPGTSTAPGSKATKERRTDPSKSVAAVEQIVAEGVCSAVYNLAFRYVISHDASTRSTIYLWNVDTGRLLSQFHKAHGSSPITAICLDREGRRLFTGCHKGDVVKTWNFNNGSLLKIFTKVCAGSSGLSSAGRRATLASLSTLQDAPLHGEKRAIATDASAVSLATAKQRAGVRARVRRRVTENLEKHRKLEARAATTVSEAATRQPTANRSLRGKSRDSFTYVPCVALHMPGLGLSGSIPTLPQARRASGFQPEHQRSDGRVAAHTHGDGLCR